MSVRVISVVWDCGRYSGATLVILLALADWADDDGGNIYPSIEIIAGKARTDRRTVQRKIRELEADGVLRLVTDRDGGKRRSAEYRIDVDLLRYGAPGDIIAAVDAAGEVAAGNGAGCETAASCRPLGQASPPETGEAARETAAECRPSAGGAAFDAETTTSGGAKGGISSLKGRQDAALTVREPLEQPHPPLPPHPYSAEPGTSEEGGVGLLFDRFWKEAPHRPGDPRGRAGEAWRAALAGGADPETIIAAVASYAEHLARPDNRERPVFAWFWLAEERWLDWPAAGGAARDPPTQFMPRASPDAPAELVGRWREVHEALQDRLDPTSLKTVRLLAVAGWLGDAVALVAPTDYAAKLAASIAEDELQTLFAGPVVIIGPGRRHDIRRQPAAAP